MAEFRLNVIENFCSQHKAMVFLCATDLVASNIQHAREVFYRKYNLQILASLDYALGDRQ